MRRDISGKIIGNSVSEHEFIFSRLPDILCPFEDFSQHRATDGLVLTLTMVGRFMELYNLMSDQIHLDWKGYARMAERFQEAIGKF